MAGTLTVQNIEGPSSGANANKIIVPSGQTLDASEGFVAPAGSVIQTEYSVLADNYSTSSYGTAFSAPISINYTPKFASSKLLLQTTGELYKDNLGQAGDSYSAWRYSLDGDVVGGPYANSDDSGYGIYVNNEGIRLIVPIAWTRVIDSYAGTKTIKINLKGVQNYHLYKGAMLSVQEIAQ